MPRHILEEPFQLTQLDAFAAHPYWTTSYVGPGPFRMERWEPGALLEAEAFDRHTLGRPKIDRIRMLFISDPNTALANLLSDTIHFAGTGAIYFQQASILKQEWAPRGGGAVLVAPGGWRYTHIQLRPELAEPSSLLDLRVRRALLHAVDKDGLNQALFEGQGIMADTLVWPSVEYFSELDRAITKYPYDLRRTEQLMAEAGFAKQPEGTFTGPASGRFATELMVIAQPQNESEMSIMAADWRRAGFDIREAILPAAQAQSGQVRASFSGLFVNVGMSTDDNQGLMRPVLGEAVPSIENGLWRVAPDGRMETTWRLRTNARWHDGNSVTLNDLLFALTVGRDPEVPEFGHAAFALIESAEATDERTVTVRWKQPYIEADRLFSRSLAGPMPRHLLQRPYAENKAGFTQLPYWNEQFVGTGPYRLRDFVAGSHVVLAANDDYVLGRPKIDVIEVRFINEPTTMVANILSGAIELTIGKTLSVEEAVEVRGQWREGRMEYAPSNAISVYSQFINPNPPIVANVQFRRALLHAIDRQQLADTLLAGLSTVAHSFMFPNQAPYREIEARLPRYDYDPRRASQMVEALGYTRASDGFFRSATDQVLSVEMRSSTTDINQKALFAIADGWQRAGVKAEPLVYSRQAGSSNEYLFTFPAFYLQRYTSDVSGLKNLQSSVIPLPENNYRSGNTSRYSNAELDFNLDRYFGTISMPERIATLGEIIYHVADQLTQLSLFYDVEPTMMSNRLRNIGPRWPSSTQTWNAHQWEVQ